MQFLESRVSYCSLSCTIRWPTPAIYVQTAYKNHSGKLIICNFIKRSLEYLAINTALVATLTDATVN